MKHEHNNVEEIKRRQFVSDYQRYTLIMWRFNPIDLYTMLMKCCLPEARLHLLWSLNVDVDVYVDLSTYR